MSDYYAVQDSEINLIHYIDGYIHDLNLKFDIESSPFASKWSIMIHFVTDQLNVMEKNYYRHYQEFEQELDGWLFRHGDITRAIDYFHSVVEFYRLAREYESLDEDDDKQYEIMVEICSIFESLSIPDVYLTYHRMDDGLSKGMRYFNQLFSQVDVEEENRLAEARKVYFNYFNVVTSYRFDRLNDYEGEMFKVWELLYYRAVPSSREYHTFKFKDKEEWDRAFYEAIQTLKDTITAIESDKESKNNE